eukprot:gene17843-18071_t
MNGTTNFMLCKMEDEGAEYEAALSEAQALGYAEADPTADVEGHDVQAKIALLTKLAFGKTVPFETIPTTGISKIGKVDFEYARSLKSTIKLLGTASSNADGSLAVFVSPTIVPLSSPLSSAKGPGNMVLINSDNLTCSTFAGPGAGRFPTANSVLNDLIRLSLSQTALDNDYLARFYIRIKCSDGLGIVRAVGEAAELTGVSIHAILQNPITNPNNVDFVVTTETVKLSQGGLGGRGGSPAAWSAADPIAGDSRTYRTSGGQDGKAGVRGCDGSPGLDGRCGLPGSLEYRIVDVERRSFKSYSSLFDLSLCPLRHEQFISSTGVFEPGQVVGVRDIRLTNLSQMASPKRATDGHGIRLQIANNGLVERGPSSYYLLPDAISFVEVVSIPQVLTFKILPAACPAVGSQLRMSASVDFEVFCTRTCRPVRGAGALSHPLTVQYPVALSLSGGKSCLHGRSLPVVMRITNRSKAAMGSPRLVRVQLKLALPSPRPPAEPDKSKVRFILHGPDLTEAQDFQFSEPINLDIGHVDPHSDLFITGEILIEAESGILCYQKLALVASLKIGDIDFPMDVPRVRTIQTEMHSFCVAQAPLALVAPLPAPFPAPAAPVLCLVTNCETT